MTRPTLSLHAVSGCEQVGILAHGKGWQVKQSFVDDAAGPVGSQDCSALLPGSQFHLPVPKAAGMVKGAQQRLQQCPALGHSLHYSPRS